MKSRRPPSTTARPEAPADPIVAFFDRQARGYDLQLILERRALRAAAALAEPLAGSAVIDLAAGTGAFSAAILDRGHALRALTLVDGAARMLERAPARLRAAGITPTLIVADARATPLADGSADVVAIGYLLHLLEPDARREVLDEAFRLLRPHGRLVVVVHGSPRGRRGSVYRRGWRLLHRLLPWGVIGDGPIVDLVPLVEAAGFAVVTSRRVPGVYWSQVVSALRPATPERPPLRSR